MNSDSVPENQSVPHDDETVKNGNEEGIDVQQHEVESHPQVQENLGHENIPAPLGQNSDAIDPMVEFDLRESIDHPENDSPVDIPVQINAIDENSEQQQKDTEANTSVTNIGTTLRPFATPSKSLPPLKDIEAITTPKSFGVAKDNTYKSSPVQLQNTSHLGDLAEAEEDGFDAAANDTFANSGTQRAAQPANAQSAEVEAAAAFLDIDPQNFAGSEPSFVVKVAQRAQKFQGLQSELSFLKLNQEQTNQVQSKKFEQLQKKLESLANSNKELQSENEANAAEVLKRNELLLEAKKQNSIASEKIEKLKGTIHQFNHGSAAKENELQQLNKTVSSLTRLNAEQGQKVSELTRELNDSTNENFSCRLELSKVSNELSYTKGQKDWYELQLKEVQDKYTVLIKKHESASLKDSTKISSLISRNESLSALKDDLASQVSELQSKSEKLRSAKAELETRLEVQSSRFSKESDLKGEKIELLTLQLEEKIERITQLEQYADDLKSSVAHSVGSLQRELSVKDNKIAQLEENLRRAEEALDSELHRETELPRLTQSAELILQEGTSGISLSTLYTEFNHMKKELVLERSQKEKLATQLQHFVEELELKKPAIANYRSRILYHEETLQDVLAKMETVRIEKVESEKECIRLRTRLASHEVEIQSIKQLSKDLGKQLCYYLIYSKMREGNENPLTAHERKVIDQIIAKSGNQDGQEESDTDRLISERLLNFASIIELQKKNEELIVAVRQSGKQLEEKETEPNGFEAVAVEEAREAISTLQSELDSISLKYEAVSKERDLLKSFNKGSTVLDETSTDIRVLQEANADLKAKTQESEKLLEALQAQSEAKQKELNNSLLKAKTNSDDLKAKVVAAEHNIELSENRLENLKKLLENAKRENSTLQNESVFWKKQASKQEELLVKKNNSYREIEQKLQSSMTERMNLQTEREVLASIKASLTDEIKHLKGDKEQLNSFVFNLQSLLKEREVSATDLSKRLSQTIENYQALQVKIEEKEERISILSSQSDMALKAQNAKLEQVNEISQKLLEARSKLAEKESVIEGLKKELSSSGFKQTITRNTSQVLGTNHDDNSPILASEYNDLKEALKVAEAQVSEFGVIAKSAEDALMKATESFNEFKETSSVKISSMEKERSELNGDLEAYKVQVGDLQSQLKAYREQASAQIQSLQERLQETTLKAESHDLMKSDYEKKLAAIGQDLKNQITVTDDLQARYEVKVSETESLTVQLSEIKDAFNKQSAQLDETASKLREACEESKAKEQGLSESYLKQQEDLQSAQTQLKDLQYQYNLALTQLELQQPSSESKDQDSPDDFRKVLSFLRTEKDAAVSKAAVASDQLEQIKLQLDSVTAELNVSRSQLSRLQSIKLELEDSSKDHARLMEQLEQMNILRESNSTLRMEYNACLDKISELQTKLDSASHVVADDNSNILAEEQAQELQLLKEENERLKNQPNNTDELENLKKRFETVKGEYLSKLSNHRNKNKELEKQLNDVKLQLESTMNEFKNLKSNDRVSAVESQLKQSEAEKATMEKKFKEQIKSLKIDFEKQKAEASAKFDAKLAEALAKTSSSAGSEAQLKEKIESEWKIKLDKATSELKAKYNQELTKAIEKRVQERVSKLKTDGSKQNLGEVEERLKKEYESKIDSLNQSFEKKLADQKTSVEKAADTKYEFKLKVLNRKIENFEKNSKAAASRNQEAEKQENAPQRSTNATTAQQTQRPSGPFGPSGLSGLSGPKNNQKNTIGMNSRIGEPADESSKLQGGQEQSDATSGKKRANPQTQPPSITFKRAKD